MVRLSWVNDDNNNKTLPHSEFNIFIWMRDVCNSKNMQNNNELIYFDMIKYGSDSQKPLCYSFLAFSLSFVIFIFFFLGKNVCVSCAVA